MPRTFYAVEFISGRNTTTGTPNPTTGRHSKAVRTAAFTSKADRDKWVSSGKVTSDMQGNCRESVTEKELRKLLQGLTTEEYNEHKSFLNYSI